MPSSFLPISAPPEVAKHMDGAECILKADVRADEKAPCRSSGIAPPVNCRGADIRRLIQRLIALATALDKRAKTGAVSPRKRLPH